MTDLSIIIPSRKDPYLQRTIDDILEKATTDIEIIVMLDGYWPESLVGGDNLRIVHKGNPVGMRPLINAAARIAKGKYILKCDAHCCFAPGFDKALIAVAKDDTLLVPLRYDLDPETWMKRAPIINQMYITAPEKGFKGKVWDKQIKGDVVDLMTFQGSCWFMPTVLFEKIGGEDEQYGTSGKEAQELGNKVWLSGGRVARHTGTWYAHHSFKRSYSLPNSEREKSRDRAIDIWTNDKWPGATRKFQWLIDKFKPPGWAITEGEKVMKEFDKCPVCGETFLESLKMKGSAWCDNCTAEYSKGEPFTMENYLLKYLDQETLFYPSNEVQPVIVPKFKRRELAVMYGKLGFKAGAEIGVAAGRMSTIFCENISGLKMLCVDPWGEQVDDPRHKKNHDQNYAKTAEALKDYDATLVKARSMDAVRDVPLDSLDFVYIDGNHIFDAIMVDVIEWARRVKPGGIVSGHDYYNFRNAGVIKAIDTYTEVHKIKQWFLTDEKCKSWWWRKPI